MCVMGIGLVSVSKNFPLDFGIVLTVCIFYYVFHFNPNPSLVQEGHPRFIQYEVNSSMHIFVGVCCLVCVVDDTLSLFIT